MDLGRQELDPAAAADESTSARIREHDVRRDAVLLFGGAPDDNSALSDTWAWDGSNWTQLHPSSSPSVRASAALSFDSIRGQAVLFGGTDCASCPRNLNDTWLWDGANWSTVTPASVPSQWGGPVMAFDASMGQIMLAGGLNTKGVSLNDLWSWDGSNWTQVSGFASIPPYANLIYDPAVQLLVVFGGYDKRREYSPLFDDTWVSNGALWVDQTMVAAQTAAGSPARLTSAMAYDAARGVTVLFGGDTVLAGDTWTWNGKAWTQMHPQTSPPLLRSASIAYDAADQVVVLFGGDNCNGPGPCKQQSDTWWTWDGVTWTLQNPANRPPARDQAMMTYDSVHQVVVLFGGCCSSTQGASLAALADSRRVSGNIVINRDQGVLNDTWTWDGSNWTAMAPSVSPDARDDGSMAFDAVHGQAVLYGGIEALTSDSNDYHMIPNAVWLWDGANWSTVTPASVPSQRGGPVMAFDASMGQVLLFGGQGSGENTNRSDTWTWDGQTWTGQTVSRKPGGGTGLAMAYDGGAGQVVLFGASDLLDPTKPSGGTFVGTWVWDGSSWTDATRPATAGTSG